MKLMLDAFWRAVVYCLYPRVIALSFLPFVLMAVAASALGYFFWYDAVNLVDGAFQSSNMLEAVTAWLERLGFGNLRPALAKVAIIMFVTPLLVLLCLLVVAVMMTPALTSLVAERRFAELERKKGGSWFTSLFWSLGSTLLALIALLVSIPLWLVPPLVMVLPPLIWGWLSYRVITFDVLSVHASAEERRQVMHQHRLPLLVMGVICGYLGAAPSIIWASGAVLAAAFVVLVPIAIWLYTLVFAFSSLWFAHYALAALKQLRAASAAAATPPAAPLTVDAATVTDVEPKPSNPAPQLPPP